MEKDIHLKQFQKQMSQQELKLDLLLNVIIRIICRVVCLRMHLSRMYIGFKFAFEVSLIYPVCPVSMIIKTEILRVNMQSLFYYWMHRS